MIAFKEKTTKTGLRTELVRIKSAMRRKLRLIAQWMNDTTAGEKISMGDLLEKWAEPHIKQYIKQAVAHSEKRNKGLLD